MKYSGQDRDCWVEPLTHTEALKLPSFTGFRSLLASLRRMMRSGENDQKGGDLHLSLHAVCNEMCLKGLKDMRKCWNNGGRTNAFHSCITFWSAKTHRCIHISIYIFITREGWLVSILLMCITKASQLDKPPRMAVIKLYWNIVFFRLHSEPLLPVLPVAKGSVGSCQQTNSTRGTKMWKQSK